MLLFVTTYPDAMTDTASAALAAALKAAFPEYLRERLTELGVMGEPHLTRALESAVETLAAALDDFVTVPMDRQRRSPLELVRSATEPVSAALAEMGVARAARDAAAVAIHPEDLYGLYPASSRDLGEPVWRLHIEWGFDKARQVAGMIPAPAEDGGRTPPAVGAKVALFGLSRERRETLAPVIGKHGYEIQVWRNPAALDGRCSAAVMALGAEAVLELDRLVDRLPGLLPRLA